MRMLLAVLCVVLGGGGLSALAGQGQSVEMEFFDSGSVSSMIGFGNCQWLYPLDEPNEPLVSEPEYASDKRVYYAARYGDAADNVHTLVIDESAGTGRYTSRRWGGGWHAESDMSWSGWHGRGIGGIAGCHCAGDDRAGGHCGALSGASAAFSAGRYRY